MPDKDLGLDFDSRAKLQQERRQSPVKIQKNVPWPPKPVSPPKVRGTPQRAHDPCKLTMREMRRIAQAEQDKECTKKRIRLPHITPSMRLRGELMRPTTPTFPRPRYLSEKDQKLKEDRDRLRFGAEMHKNYCKYDVDSMPRPLAKERIPGDVAVGSPDVSKAQFPVTPTAREAPPDQPKQDELQLHKPTSGVFINVPKTRRQKDKFDSFDLLFKKQTMGSRARQRRRARMEKLLRAIIKWLHKVQKIERIDRDMLVTVARNIVQQLKAKKAGLEPPPPQPVKGLESKSSKAATDTSGAPPTSDTDGEETYLTKQFRKKVRQISEATSLNSKELEPVPADEEPDDAEMMHKIIQKFRQDSEEPRYRPVPRRVHRGTFESHSFTTTPKKVERILHFCLIQGTFHQGDDRNPSNIRNKQGMCIPIAAYCLSMMKHPSKWDGMEVDEILDVGNALMVQSIEKGLLNVDQMRITGDNLVKYCLLRGKKVYFEVYKPDIVGTVRSTAKNVYNLNKALRIFFGKFRAGIVQTLNTDILIWRDKRIYFFDGRPRDLNMFADENGKAGFATFYDTRDISDMLLRTDDLEDWPFTISKISVVKVCDEDEPEPKDYSLLQKGYEKVTQGKAILQASFELSNLCFEYSRNKQAIPMCTVALTYSRITPPGAWVKITLDKIIVIGNQLYLAIAEGEQTPEITLDNLPAYYTIGPYMVNILILQNMYADHVWKNNEFTLPAYFEAFFKSNTMALLSIGKSTLALWQQRGMYYLFDPYSRNSDGMVCRNGVACVAMCENLECIMDLLQYNYSDRKITFYIHGLKVLKIQRDPMQAHLFPKNIQMEDISQEMIKAHKMRKSKRRAIANPVTADVNESGVRNMSAGDSVLNSIVEVSSDVVSISPDILPDLQPNMRAREIAQELMSKCRVTNLDSPSLSDTQIEPAQPSPSPDDVYVWKSLSDEYLMEELALQQGEGEDFGGEDMYMAIAKYAQVGDDLLDEERRIRMHVEVNTDITCGMYALKRSILKPTNMKRLRNQLKARELMRRLKEEMEDDEAQPHMTQSQELLKPNNFTTLPDDTQIIAGTGNISAFGTDDLDYMAPFVAIIATVVAKKYLVSTWTPDIVDYALRCGFELYKASKVRYDQVPILEISKVSLGKTDYSITVQYLFDSNMKRGVLEEALKKYLFNRYEAGIVVTRSYACAVFYRNGLYYMYDGFGCNEVGLSTGVENTGNACLSRFKTMHDLLGRIMYNKSKRDNAAEFKYMRFVVSAVTSQLISMSTRSMKRNADGTVTDEGEDGNDDRPECRDGYQFRQGGLSIQGSDCLTGRSSASPADLKEDHFVCVCAALMVLDVPLPRWGMQTVDYVLEQGKTVHAHVASLTYAPKRIVRNILINKHFFDVIINLIKLPGGDQGTLMETLPRAFLKRRYVIVQYPNCCALVYRTDEHYNLFDPYACSPNGAVQSNEADGKAGWVLLKNIEELVERLKAGANGSEQCTYYTFQVMSIKKVTTKLGLSRRMQERELGRRASPLDVEVPFNEERGWLKKDPITWSRMYKKRCNARMWRKWYVEYPNDLYSLDGTIMLIGDQQVLCNMVVAIGMLEIYSLCDWNKSILDSIIVHGGTYFDECTRDIPTPNYELKVDDIKSTCNVFPYTFDVTFLPIVEGSMFTKSPGDYNLYRALRFFSHETYRRFGVICAQRPGGKKRWLAFGKIHQGEFFMFDCQANGPPMFVKRQSKAYCLRCLTMNRLVHVMTLTLRGGDFFIFEVCVTNLRPMVS